MSRFVLFFVWFSLSLIPIYPFLRPGLDSFLATLLFEGPNLKDSVKFEVFKEDGLFDQTPYKVQCPRCLAFFVCEKVKKSVGGKGRDSSDSDGDNDEQKAMLSFLFFSFPILFFLFLFCYLQFTLIKHRVLIIAMVAP